MQTYDRLSRWYDLLSAWSERPPKQAGLELLDPQPGEHILEIGSGTGEILAQICHEIKPDGGAVWLDLSRGMLQVAERKVLKASCRADLIQANALVSPFQTMSFDSVFVSFTLELFDTPLIPALLTEIQRLLKPGGRLVVVSMHRSNRPNPVTRAYEWLHTRFPAVLDCRPIPVVELLESSGFIIEADKYMSVWGLPVAIARAVHPDIQPPSS